MPGEQPLTIRDRAPEHLVSTSDQIDRMLSVTPARGWIALTTILAAVAAVTVWSIVGDVATYVEAHGFLLNRGGRIVDAVATGQGRLSQVTVAVGDDVKEDAVVAVIVNEEITTRHAGAVALVEERKQALEALEAAVAEESAAVHANNARLRSQLEEFEATALDMLELARISHENNQRLFQEGVVSRVELERSQRHFNESREAVLGVRRDRDALETETIRFRNDNAARIREMTGQVEAANRELRQLATLLSADAVRAPVPGQVIEIKATTGAVVGAGQAVLSIRTGTTDLEVLLYVPPEDGPKVAAGMEALVAPVTVRREEFGAIRGKVESLSSFPASFDGMVAVLQNPSLVASFSEDGPPYAGRITLLSDPVTRSGFAWTSPKAVDQMVTAGTLASVEIKTRSQPPISLAIPLLRELLGIR